MMFKKSLQLTVLGITTIVFMSCEKEIKTVQIGQMIWMQQNLDTDTFANGDEIPEVKSDSEWERFGQEGKPAWCHYDNDPTNGKVLGKLYNWYAVNSSKGLCPKGWHITSDDEWTAISNKMGGDRTSAENMKSTIGWKVGGIPGNNQSKLTILPGGTRNKDGFFNSAGRSAYLWTSNTAGPKDARDRGFEYNSSEIVRDYSDMAIGFSCRCVKD